MRGAKLGLAAAMLLCALSLAWRPVRARAEGEPGLKARIELGRRLFYDADLSIDGTMSCATCHEQHRGFADGNATHGGVHGAPGRRNVPGLANVGAFTSLTWSDPRVRTLEAQVAIPVLGTHPIEMGMTGQEAELARRLAVDPCYRRMFANAFPGGGGAINFAKVAQALAAFERTLTASAPSPATPLARKGAAVFLASGCASCHAGPLFTDMRFHRIAPLPAGAEDRGLAETTARAEDEGAFRTPSLINVGVTQPYLHDGSAQTLGDAIDRHRGTALRGDDRTALIAYLRGLTDRAFLTDPRFSLPQHACGRRL